MIPDSDLQRWQQAINGIATAQNELSPKELQAFQALIECINTGNFEADESGGYIQIMKNALKQHTKNRLLTAYLTNFVTLCEKYFKVKTVAPVINPPQITLPAFEPPTFIEVTPAPKQQVQTFTSPPQVSSADLPKWQQAINGVTTAQNELSSEELSAFHALVELCNNGNFEANESNNYIRVIKNASQHTKNRLLQVHLKNFVTLCEKYFKMPTGAFSTKGSGTQQIKTEKKSKSSGGSLTKTIIVIGIIGIVLAGSYFLVKDSEWFNNLFSGGQKVEEKANAEKQKEDSIALLTEQANKQQAIIDSMSRQIDSVQETKTVQPEVQPTSQTHNTDATIPGKYPQASERLLTAADLQNLSKESLKIMRNEIFARHGYIFKTIDMKTYFKYQDWYKPQYDNVNSMLTNIEQKNIEFIKRYE